ncbi:toll/interleukin-1 receptor domain-containing protein [Lysinibacillus sp. G4S2]|uniref:toll/interleukin-1 receptor domain-containing protein n=1 Tax=Lysinibacillus sp. G4S2 TaxID=3055859 RepID=UPI0025A2079B|nr:toll/interleukin-1 receptor domain-containing protein [Lysinibacillus sp. G4S2]MDM5249628.1 toll/interleukin-1 receptor domain-containing protein [Lysinibacillus sp. G4S2]
MKNKQSKFLMLLTIQIILLAFLVFQLTDYLPEMQKSFNNIFYDYDIWLSILGSVCSAFVVLIMMQIVLKNKKRTRKPRVFISYAHKDKEMINKIKGKLFRLDIKVIENIEIGEIIEERLIDIIEQCDYFVVFYSKDYAESAFCKIELEHIIQSGKRIIPLIYTEDMKDEIEVNSYLNKLLYLRVSKDNFDLMLLELLKVINRFYIKDVNN